MFVRVKIRGKDEQYGTVNDNYFLNNCYEFVIRLNKSLLCLMDQKRNFTIIVPVRTFVIKYLFLKN